MSNKSVFLYWKPTKNKKDMVIYTQELYTNEINCFIDALISDETFYLDLFNNQNQSPRIREYEKNVRSKTLKSAYSQNAIDHAVKELHNHFTRIKNKLFGYCSNKRKELISYFSSTALLNASILDNDEIELLSNLLVNETQKKKPSKLKIMYYTDLFMELITFTDDQRINYREEVRQMFYEKLDHWKVPHVKWAPLQLDTRLCRFENPINTDADKVLCVKLIGSSKWVEIPVKTSKNSLRRLEQYENGSPTITFKNGYIKVSIPFEKKVEKYDTNKLRGTDVGITDLIYASNSKSYGSFSGMTKAYDDVLGKKVTNRSKLRNHMREMQKELKKKSTPKTKKEYLRIKIENIANTLNGKKKLNKCQNQYSHEVTKRLNEAVKSYLKDIKQDKVLPVLESLDITEFDRDKKSNKRDSSWIRGQLMKKLKESFEWYGIPYIEVDPAYTSKGCPKCFNIDDENRYYKKFKCTVCHHEDDADHNASINIENRAFDKELHEIVEQNRYDTKKRHKAIKMLFQKRHQEWMMSHLKTNETTEVAT